MAACSKWNRRGAGIALAAIIACSTALALRWVFLVPVFQAPDESDHFDYALVIHDYGGLIRSTPGTKWSDLTHPHSWHLANRTHVLDLQQCFGYVYLSLDYGTREYFNAIDRDAPPRPTREQLTAPGLARVYPFGYYAILALWMEGVRWVAGDGPARMFLGARCFSVFLLAITLFFSYRTLREIQARRWLALVLTACMGCFPLISFVGSYVQPDNLALTLISIGFYLALRLRRQPDRLSLQAALGVTLGVLTITKMHFALCLALPLAGMVASAWLTRPPGLRGALRCTLALVVPSALLLLIHLWVTAHSTNHLRFAYGQRPGLAFYLNGFVRALTDYFMGTTHASFWGYFGPLSVPLVIGKPTTNQVVRFAVQTATWVVLSLALVRLEQVAARLFHVARRGHFRRACQIAFSNLPVNSLFLFTVMMFALHVRTENRFGAQGRNWAPLLLPIFWIAVVYAPRALRLRAARSLVGLAHALLLLFFATVGSAYAIKAIKQAYYFTPDKAEQARREPAVVRRTLAPAKDCRPLPLDGPRRWSFVCPLDDFEAVEVLLGTSRLETTSKLTLRLLNEAGEELAVAHAEAPAGQERLSLPFPLPQQLTGQRGKRLQLELTTEPARGAGRVVVWSPGDGAWASQLVTTRPGQLLESRGRVATIEKLIPQEGAAVGLAGGPVEFRCKCPFDTVQGFDIRLSTCCHTNPGFVVLQVEDENGRPLGSSVVQAPFLKDNSWRWFPLADISGLEGKRLRLRLTYLVPPGQVGSVVAWRSGADPEVLVNRLIGK